MNQKLPWDSLGYCPPRSVAASKPGKSVAWIIQYSIAEARRSPHVFNNVDPANVRCMSHKSRACVGCHAVNPWHACRMPAQQDRRWWRTHNGWVNGARCRCATTILSFDCGKLSPEDSAADWARPAGWTTEIDAVGRPGVTAAGGPPQGRLITGA